MVTRILIAGVVLALTAPPSLAGTQTRTSRFEYDAQGWLIREIVEPDNPALCLVNMYAYDSHGNKTSTTTRNCNGSTSGGVIEAATPTCATPGPICDAVFQSRTSSLGYDAKGLFAISSTNALGQTETRTFDSRFGTATSRTDPNNLTTNWTHDNFGRKASETRPDGTANNSFYERCADLAGACPASGQYRVRVTATGSPATSTYYDGGNREIRTETQGFDGTPVLKDTAYDSFARVSQVSFPYYAGATPALTLFTYDRFSRVIQSKQPATSSGQAYTNTSRSGMTTTVTVSNAVSGTGLPGGVTQSRTTTKNSQGQVAQVKDAQNNTLTFTYDEFGNSKTSTDALGNVTSFTYDLRGRKTQMVDPDMGTWTYAYDAASDLIRQTDAKGQVVAMQYDPLARLTNRSEPDLISAWTYDICVKGMGKICQINADNTFSRSYGYDSFGRQATVVTTIGNVYTVTTGYDSASRVSTLTYPTNVAALYVYNGFGYLLEVRDNASGALMWRAQAMSASGKVTQELLGSGLTTTRTYDVLDHLISVVTSGTAGAVQNSTYTYDPLGNITDRTDGVNGVTEHFAYDNLNRLTMDSGTGPVAALATRSFDYNAIGNMIYKSDVGSGTYTYPASGAGSVRPHAVSSITGTVDGIANPTFAYDSNGNLTSGLGRTLSYTSFNMPLNLAQGSNSFAYNYSPDHERVRVLVTRPTGTTETHYVHPNGNSNLLYEQEFGPNWNQPGGVIEYRHYVNTTSGLVAVYVTKSTYTAGEGPGIRYFHRDQIDSITAVTNDAGARIENLAYEAFGKRRFPDGTADPGNTIIGVTTDRGFTTHEHLDDIQLIHMNGRVYDPLLGRFMTPDPGVPYPSNLQSFNRYSYTRNNPLVLRDPSGFDDQGFGGFSYDFEFGSSSFSLLDRGLGASQDPAGSVPWACGANFQVTGTGIQTPSGDFQNFWNGLTGHLGVMDLVGNPAGNAGVQTREVAGALGRITYDVATGVMIVVGIATLDPPAEGIGLRMLAAREAGSIATGGTQHIVLGLRAFGLGETAARVGGETLLNNTAWRTAMQEAIANPSARFTISVEGLSGSSTYSQIMGAAQRGLTVGATPTNWEIAQLYQAGRLGEVTFVDRFGNVLANPFK